MQPCVKHNDHRDDMLHLAMACQHVIEQVIDLLDDDRVPDLEAIRHAAALMTEEGRLGEVYGLAWNMTVQWTINAYKKTLAHGRRLPFGADPNKNGCARCGRAADSRVLQCRPNEGVVVFQSAARLRRNHSTRSIASLCRH